MQGTVYLVGGCPGDPELLTLKAARLIGAADAIVYDHLVGAAILDLARQDADCIYVGKQAGRPFAVEDYAEQSDMFPATTITLTPAPKAAGVTALIVG